MPHLLVDIEPTAFTTAEVLLGPRSTEADQLMVEAIAKAYCSGGFQTSERAPEGELSPDKLTSRLTSR